jgi:hypothetical protein
MRQKAIELVELRNVKAETRAAFPAFKVGDTVKVHTKISEGDKERIQVFEASASSASSRPTRRASTSSKSSRAPPSSARACSISAICRARPLASRAATIATSLG